MASPVNNDRHRLRYLEDVSKQIADNASAHNLSHLAEEAFIKNPNLAELFLDRVTGQKLKPENLVEKVQDHLQKPPTSTRTTNAKLLTPQNNGIYERE